MSSPTRACPALPPSPLGPPTTTANVPSGYSFILLQIRTPHRSVHPLGSSIGVHPKTGRRESGYPCWPPSRSLKTRGIDHVTTVRLDDDDTP